MTVTSINVTINLHDKDASVEGASFFLHPIYERKRALNLTTESRNNCCFICF